MRWHTGLAITIGVALLATSTIVTGRSFRDTEGGASCECDLGGRCQCEICESFVERGDAPKRHAFVCGIKNARRNGTSAPGPDRSLAIVLGSDGTVRCVARGRIQIGAPHNFFLGGPRFGVPTVQFTASTPNAVRTPASVASTGRTSPRAGTSTVGTVIRNGKFVCVILSRAELLQYDPCLAAVPNVSEVYGCGRIGRRFSGACPFFDVDPSTRCGVLRGCTYNDPVVCGVLDCELPDVPVCFE